MTRDNLPLIIVVSVLIISMEVIRIVRYITIARLNAQEREK